MKRAMYAIPAVGLSFFGCGDVEGPPVEQDVCGDGNVTGNEECDDGNAVDTDDCPTTCENARCNDGFVQFAEEDCDDGNDSDNDACTNRCTNAVCGDQIVYNEATGTESCDDGNDIQNDGCNACAIDPIVRAFELKKIRNVTLTDVATYQLCTQSGTYGCYVYTTCSRDVETPFTVSQALFASGTYTRNRDCADNAADNIATRQFTGSAEVLVFRQKYKITVTEDATTVILTCDMDTGSNLTCKDNAATPTDWAFTAK